MPTISRFYGITVMIYNNDHPPPHVHIRYGSKNACVRIDDGTLLQGKFPKRQLAFVKEWVLMHRDSLIENWNLALAHAEVFRIEPLA